jgi:hypothetical protein
MSPVGCYITGATAASIIVPAVHDMAPAGIAAARWVLWLYVDYVSAGRITATPPGGRLVGLTAVGAMSPIAVAVRDVAWAPVDVLDLLTRVASAALRLPRVVRVLIA